MIDTISTEKTSLLEDQAQAGYHTIQVSETEPTQPPNRVSRIAQRIKRWLVGNGNDGRDGTIPEEVEGSASSAPPAKIEMVAETVQKATHCCSPACKTMCGFSRDEKVTYLLGISRDFPWASSTLAGFQVWATEDPESFDTFWSQTVAQCGFGLAGLLTCAIAVGGVLKCREKTLTAKDIAKTIIVPLMASLLSIPGWNYVVWKGTQYFLAKGLSANTAAIASAVFPGPTESFTQQFFGWIGEAIKLNGIKGAPAALAKYLTDDAALARFGHSVKKLALNSPGGSVWQLSYMAIYMTLGASTAGIFAVGALVAGTVCGSSMLSQLEMNLLDAALAKCAEKCYGKRQKLSQTDEENMAGIPPESSTSRFIPA